MIRSYRPGPRSFLWVAGSLSACVTLAVCKAQTAPRPAMTLGVQTHFAQNWPLDRLDLAASASAGSLRDSASWAQVETEPGRYRFDDPRLKALDRACRAGQTLLLTAVPLSPLYDSGGALRSPGAKAAFAAYLVALQDHFGKCLAGIEIGNEVNSTNSRQIYRPGETGTDPLREYVELVRAARDAFRRRNAPARIVGGSSNMIATGFLDSLFARGLLDAADAIAVHPYRSQADNLDVELEHLDAVMRRHGRPLPVWATEFSDNYPQTELAPPQLVKAVTLMAAGGVKAAYWYALVDQKWFRNMGLFDARGAPKPAMRAFRLVQQDLLANGPPRRIDVGDTNVRLYRFGDGAFVAWGASGRIRFNGAVRLRDAQGAPIAGNEVLLGDDPVIATGADRYTFMPGPVVADSLLGYASADWRYLARGPDGKEQVLGWLDGQWTSSHGDRYRKPLWIGDVGGVPTGAAERATRVIVRYTAPVARTVSIAACIDKRAGGDGIDVAFLHGATVMDSGIVTSRRTFALRDVRLAAGETLDLVVGPNARPGSDSFRYRIRIAAEPDLPSVDCPQRSAPV